MHVIEGDARQPLPGLVLRVRHVVEAVGDEEGRGRGAAGLAKGVGSDGQAAIDPDHIVAPRAQRETDRPVRPIGVEHGSLRVSGCPQQVRQSLELVSQRVVGGRAGGQGDYPVFHLREGARPLSGRSVERADIQE